MPSFQYEALDTNGKTHHRPDGRRLASSRSSRSSTAPASCRSRPTEARAKRGRSLRDILTPEPKSEDITAMTLDIVMLLKGGVTLSETLSAASAADGRQPLAHQGAARDASGDLRRQDVLASAVRASAAVLADLHQDGRGCRGNRPAGGGARHALAEERQRMERMRKRLIGAIAYPAFLDRLRAQRDDLYLPLRHPAVRDCARRVPRQDRSDRADGLQYVGVPAHQSADDRASRSRAMVLGSAPRRQARRARSAVSGPAHVSRALPFFRTRVPLRGRH